MKVLHIITGLSMGGAEMMLLKTLKATDKNKFEPLVISLTDSGEIGSRIKELGVPVLALSMSSGVSGLLSIFRLVKQIKKASPEIIQTWMYHADLLGGLAAKLAGYRNIVWNIRNSDLDPLKTKLHTRITVKVCAFLSSWVPKKIISNSSNSALIHQQAGYQKDKFTIIPNGFDLQEFSNDKKTRESVRKELGFDEDICLIGFVARFDPQKDHKGFVEAAALLKSKVNNVHFLLIGKDIDADNQQLNNWINSVGLTDSFRLLGLRSDVSRITSAFDLATSSSSYGEAFPNVIGEAMACGIPCVVTDVGDSALIIGATGKVVPPDNPQALADAWQSLLLKSDAERHELGLIARKRIEENFSIKAITRQYEHLYMDVVG